MGDFILILACVKKTHKFLFGGKEIAENVKIEMLPLFYGEKRK